MRRRRLVNHHYDFDLLGAGLLKPYLSIRPCLHQRRMIVLLGLLLAIGNLARHDAADWTGWNATHV